LTHFKPFVEAEAEVFSRIKYSSDLFQNRMDRIERRSSDRDGYTDRERRPVSDKHADRDRNSTIKTEQERKQKKKSKRHRSPSSSSSSESSDSAARRKKRKNKRKKKDLMSMSITDRWGMRGM
jgi:hypothetical protein